MSELEASLVARKPWDTPEPPADPPESEIVEGPPDLVYQKLPHYIMWVFENIENHSCKRKSAPSLGAWAMLKTARESPLDFMKTFVPKALAILEKQGKVDAYEAEIQELERRPIAELESLIAEAVGRRHEA